MAARSGPDPRLARARLRELMVDPARFSAEPDTIAAYVEPGSKPDNLYCVVYPRGQTDIEQVLAVARSNGLAVYTPQAWGINAKRPGFIVDYKFMADIKSVDAKNLYLLLEPGVTWEQVLGELASQDVRVALPAAARSPYVLESALEREVVLPAVRFTNKQLSTFHVLLADGREYRSGSDALDNSVAHWREDGGPQHQPRLHRLAQLVRPAAARIHLPLSRARGPQSGSARAGQPQAGLRAGAEVRARRGGDRGHRDEQGQGQRGGGRLR